MEVPSVAVETLHFDFHGTAVTVTTNDAETARFVESDFSWFLVEEPRRAGPPSITVDLHFSEVPFDRIPEGKVAAYHTKDAVVYKEGSTAFYDSGEALVIYDFAARRAEVHSLSRDLLFERAYLMISSRVGDAMDRRGLHRIHAMGVAYRGRGVVCLMPSGGGKTTLTLSLMKDERFQLLSEEIPLVTRRGELLPFPIRMGVRPGESLSIPVEFLKPFERTHYGPKTLIDVRCFAGRIAGITEPGIVFAGKRIHSDRPAVVPISRMKAFMALYRCCVAGVGLPQMLEYILRFDLSDIFRNTPVILSRLVASIRLIGRSQTYELRLGRDREANARCVADFVASIFSGERRERK